MLALGTFKMLWLRIIVEPMAGSVSPVGRHRSHAHLPHRLVPPTRPPCQTRRSHTSVERQWHRQQTDGTKHLPRGAQRQSGGHSGVQDHGTIEKSHPELHPSTTGSTPRPRRGLLFFIHNSVSFTRKPQSTTSKNDPT